jgi:glycosyltransferase involved in cell wall biosynthesis
MNNISRPKKKLIWLTADYFLDCDVEIIKNLSNYYNIHWHIILPKKGSRYSEFEIKQWKLANLEINIHWNIYRLRDPLSLLFFWKLFKQIKRELYDILYLNYTPSPFFAVAATKFLNKHNTIVSAHQGEVYKGFKYNIIYKVTYKLFYSFFKFVNMFSESETTKFKRTYPKSTVFTIPLALKDFGKCTVSKSSERIEFFNFGTIRPGKNIGLLIEAACSLYDEGAPKFRVTIAGECDNWETYNNKIKYPEIFNLIIRRISSQEISEMFCQYHYLILPYSIVTQSGPLKIAYNYNVPVIASNLPGFSNEIINNETGFLFESGNVEDLKRVLLQAINTHSYNYHHLKQKLAEYVKKEYSNDEILKKYKTMFETVVAFNHK